MFSDHHGKDSFIRTVVDGGALRFNEEPFKREQSN